MDVAKIVTLAAVIFALVAGVVTIQQAAVIIALLGLAGGYFVEEERRLHFMVATLTLALAHGALAVIPVVGLYLTDALASLSALFNAAACTVIIMAIIDRLKP